MLIPEITQYIEIKKQLKPEETTIHILVNDFTEIAIENIKKLLINNMIFETFTFDYYVELNNFNVVGVYDSDLRAV